jgi:hypothetical protein
MTPKIFGILFLIIAVGAIVFLGRSGVVDKLMSLGTSSSSSGTVLAPVFHLPNQNYGANVPSYSYTPPPASPQPSSSQQSISPSDIPAGFTASQLSPYFHKIRFSSIWAGSYYSYGQISIRNTSYQGESPINVTGWLIQGNRGGQYIPQAVNVYNPSGLAAPGDIYMKSGDTVNIYTSRSAIGLNFRLNKCIGYLENTNDFVPSLPANCPAANRSEISGFTGICQNYILSIGSCQLPAANPPVPYNDYGCLDYLNTLNYSGCFNRHQGDPDFLSSEWRVWTGNRFLDESHDRVLLFDGNGLLVDLYEY